MYNHEGDDQKSLLICEMDASQRPREKAMAQGFDSLSDAEVMAIIFATGIKGTSVLDLCKDILKKNMGHLSLVTRKPWHQLVKEHKGIGAVKAITLLAALELGRRASEDSKRMAQEEPLSTSLDAYERMKAQFQWLQHEEFWVLYLNQGGKVVSKKRISMGSTNSTSVDVKLIMRYALDCLAASMVLCHNHPSGTLRPSTEDDHITKKIEDAARLFDVRVFDHIIFTDGSYYSYSDHSRL
ncbi:MAG: DNA repair protein RadC [Bacteroidales bacterium]|nr:DNA repair protein RadC [Bacteroidales bacterium]